MRPRQPWDLAPQLPPATVYRHLFAGLQEFGKAVLSLTKPETLCFPSASSILHFETMPRFLRRIFSDKHLSFRRDPSTQDDVQPSRRVITKPSTGKSETRLRARLSQLNLAFHPEEIGRPQDGASLADSEMRAARPILAPSIASHERYSPAPKTKAPRRKLSKRHRMPDLKAA